MFLISTFTYLITRPRVSSPRVSRVCCYFLTNCTSRRCFFIIRPMEFVVSVGSSVIDLF